MARILLKELPEAADPSYLSALIDNCVEAYTSLQSDTMALDYCGVGGKNRALILDNPEYKRRTKIIRAEKYLDEIDEIETLTRDLRGTKVTEGTYDMRDPKQANQYEREYKDLFNMRLKAAEMRRELLNLSRKDDEKEEADALNIFFVPLTPSEFEALKTTEVHFGTDDGKAALNASEDSVEKVLGSAKYNRIKEEDEEGVDGGFIINADGSATDI